MTEGTATLLFASAAVLATVLGVVPFARGGRVATASLAWANAAAGGLMLGSAYALADHLPPGGSLAMLAGAVLGAGLLFAFHVGFIPSRLEVDAHGGAPAEARARLLFVSALHAAAEGAAIGVAVMIDLNLGVVLTATLALHNVAEATALLGAMRPAGLTRSRQVALVVAVKLPQLVLALAVFALIHGLPMSLPWAAGFAVGALAYLVLADLLPLAYREAGHTSIAVVVSAALGIVVLLTALWAG
jgi:zinc transporter, ZIP family